MHKIFHQETQSNKGHYKAFDQCDGCLFVNLFPCLSCLLFFMFYSIISALARANDYERD